MGNNSAFSSYEAVILATYKHKALTKALMLEIVAAFSDVDADSGGYRENEVDGKNLYEIVIEVGGGTVPVRPVLPRNYKDWTTDHENENDAYQEALCEQYDLCGGL